MTEVKKYYIWVGSKTGYFFSTFEKCPILKNKGEKLSFLGFTFSSGWPKVMSTGRILYKPNTPSLKKTRKNRKKLG